MKGARVNYQSVEKLPENAKTISQYAKESNISIAYVYKLYKKGEIKIVTFQNINFVI